MNRLSRIRHEFVEFIPDQLREGVLYISIPFTTAVHLCCCGCGSEVVTPISPRDWRLTFDGATTSLSPSIGNWSYPCRSHYWILRDQVRWAARMTAGQIEADRTKDARERELYFERLDSTQLHQEPDAEEETTREKPAISRQIIEQTN